MATEKTLKARVKMKHGKESEWALATKFTPLIGEIIVYDVDNNHTSPRFKVGDGITNVNNLKFVNQDELAKITTLGDDLLAVKNGYLPLSGGTVTGTLTINKELYSNAAVISKRNSTPQFIMQNANGAQLGSIYSSSSDGNYGNIVIVVNQDSSSAAYYTFSNFGRFASPVDVQTANFRAKSNQNPSLSFLNNSEAILSEFYVAITDGSYGNTMLKVSSSATKASYFTFKNDGIFAAPSDIISNGGILKSSRNTNPCLALTNQNGAWLASLVVATSDGSYGNAQLAVYKSATEGNTFTFSNQGSFRAPNTVYSSLFAAQSNNNPQLMLQNASGAPLGMLYINTTTGAYSNAVLRVYSSASAYSSYSFGNDGNITTSGIMDNRGVKIRGNSYPGLSFINLDNSKVLAYLQPQTSAGDYADVLLAVKSSSGQSNFLFAMNGDLTIGKKLYNPGGQVVKRLGLTSSGTNGYIKFATINLTGTTYQNQPIRIAIAQRGRYGSFKLRFASVNSADPAVEQFVKTGQIEVYIHKSATSIWDLYLHKSEAYDDIDVTVYENGSHNSFKFTWADTLVSALPTGYVTASEETWSGAAASANTLNNTLAISKGGTGSTTASGALTNLGALPLTGGTLTGTLTAKALYASDGNVVGSHLVTQTNNYPEVYFKNAAGATLADLWVNTTTGSYAPVILRVHADASTSKDFTFGKDGTFSIPNSFSTVMGEIKSNAWPQLFFRNGNGNSLAQFVIPTNDGSYNGLVVNVFSDASSHVEYKFNSDGTFKAPFAVEAARTYVKTNNYPEHIFQNANGVTLAELYANTTTGAYAPIILRVKQSVDGFSEFTFGRDGTFTAPAGIATTGNYISIKNNSYPQLTFSNASGADIGKFFVSTTNGSYAATKIRAYSSASSYYDFQFLGTGSFSCKTINADGIDIGADSLVQLSQNDNKGSGCISIGNINLGDWRVISVADDGRLLIDYTNPIYALGSSVIYSSSQPSSPTTGMIWLKPV